MGVSGGGGRDSVGVESPCSADVVVDVVVSWLELVDASPLVVVSVAVEAEAAGTVAGTSAVWATSGAATTTAGSTSGAVFVVEEEAGAELAPATAATGTAVLVVVAASAGTIETSSGGG